MFHAELYDWLVSQGRTDDLLEVRLVQLPFSYSLFSYLADSTYSPIPLYLFTDENM
jgi:hypothetical protein